MPNARIFVPQALLESWLTDGRAQLSLDTLTLASARFQLASALRFLREVPAGEDELKLVGRVKTHAQLEPLRIQHAGNTVLLAGSAYEVVDGYALTPEVPEGRDGDVYASLMKLFQP